MVETSHYTVSDCLSLCASPQLQFMPHRNASARGAGKEGIEAMARVKAIALDKTRTITYGSQTFLMFSPKRNQPPELLACTAGTEILSEHPLAQAIVAASRAEGFEPHKQKPLKHHGKRTTARCLVCENETVL
jgi:Cd2+/Zn2+-exporting ATPase